MILKDFLYHNCIVCNQNNFDYIDDLRFWERDTISISDNTLTVKDFGSVEIITEKFYPTQIMQYNNIWIEKFCQTASQGPIRPEYFATIELTYSNKTLKISDLQKEGVSIYYPPNSHPNAPEEGGRITLVNRYNANCSELETLDGYQTLPLFDLQKFDWNNKSAVYEELSKLMILL
jgi:hypothetical protein